MLALGPRSFLYVHSFEALYVRTGIPRQPAECVTNEFWIPWVQFGRLTKKLQARHIVSGLSGLAAENDTDAEQQLCRIVVVRFELVRKLEDVVCGTVLLERVESRSQKRV